MTDRLVVLLRGQIVGDWSRNRLGQYTFTYREGYRNTGRIPLSPALPISDTRFGHQAVTAYVEGLLPESPDVRGAWAAELKTGETAFDLLAVMGRDCVGAVQFAHDDALDELTRRAADYRPVSNTEIGARLAALHATGASWTLPEEHWSLPGAQEKFTLARLANRWHEARGAAASTHIVKPGVARLRHQAVLEYATMQVAARLGLTVAATELADFAGETAIVITRFDRYHDPSSAVCRLHQVDFCQAMGRMPANKYEERNGPRTAELAAMLRRESALPEQDVRHFSDAVLFNYVVGAPDAHAKNFALLYPPRGRPRMAPLYDLSSALAYEPRAGGYDLSSVAMSIGGRRKFGQVLKKNFERHADEMKLDRAERLARVADLAIAAPDAFRSVLAGIDSPAAQDVADRLLPRLERHTQEITRRVAETSG
ncbi:type II toxin-antitoxin system HipA family toxin [Mycobacterium sp. M1]|uniref:Type II toxin-antitoxin system HipA family toxin n=1 Tax=Mycolicibacter acidiphilus TaxID=2835306 RepID=A0ABS5RH99_9MYCO|nr:type II toxin-antitoxin system HipA family toxin [Mycolicibacter acidiphilus]MBS9533657.1 type II toxin-antitoxin system HipA family toxin [Mycolicibacter acidiphilus]